MSQQNFEHKEHIDSLRLSRDEQKQIFARMGEQELPSAGERRGENRLNYHKEAGLIVQMHHPGGSIVNYLVRSRNLSSGGIAFLHGAFVYQGTRCAVALMTTANRVAPFNGKVVRCQLVHRHIHDVGVCFDRPIRLSDFIPPHAVGGNMMGAEQALPRLSGRVLYVEDSISDQELMRFHLASVDVTMQTAANGLAAMDMISSTRYDMVITGVWLPIISGIDLARSMRESNYKEPIVAMSADARIRRGSMLSPRGVRLS